MIIRGPQRPGLSRRRAMLAAGAGLATPGLARAQAGRGPGAWPERPVNLVVGFPPGAQTDLAARSSRSQVPTASPKRPR